MDKLFLTILNMTLTGAFVIAAICLARLPLKRAPKIISYSLWAVAGFRLVFPFSIEGVFSLLPFKAQPIPPDIATQPIPHIDSGIPFVNEAVSEILPVAAPNASINPLQLWTSVGAYVWIAGAAVMLLYGMLSYILLKRKMRSAIRVEDGTYESDAVQSPFVLGLFKPRIYMPPGLSDGERKYILLHEQTHIRRRDHLIKCAAYFILCMHWFNPLAWVAFVLMGADMEMSCDERVLKEIGVETKKDYSMSLLSLAASRPMLGGSPLAFSEGGLKERIKNVLNFSKKSRAMIILAVVLVAVLSIGFVVNRAVREPLVEMEMVYEENPATFLRDMKLIWDDEVYCVTPMSDDKKGAEIGYAKDQSSTWRIYELKDYGRDYLLAVESTGAWRVMSTHSPEVPWRQYILENPNEKSRAMHMLSVTLFESGTAGLATPPISSFALVSPYYYAFENDELLIFYDKNEPFARFAVIDDYTIQFKSATVPLYADAGTKYVWEGEPTETPLDEDADIDESALQSSWKPLADLPADYTLEQAVADHVYVNIHGTEIYNQQQVDTFYEAALAGIPAFMRIMQYTIEGDAILTDYQYDGEVFTITHDTTRDKFGLGAVSTGTYQYLVPLDNSSRPEEPVSYYLSNDKNLFTISGDGRGTKLKGDLLWIPSPTSVAEITPEDTIRNLYSIEDKYIPIWMKPNSVITYNENAVSTIVEGGKLTAEDSIGTEHMDMPYSTEASVKIVPYTRVEYDLHGFLQNIYYLNPDHPGEYRLDPTNWWPGEKSAPSAQDSPLEELYQLIFDEARVTELEFDDISSIDLSLLGDSVKITQGGDKLKVRYVEWFEGAYTLDTVDGKLTLSAEFPPMYTQYVGTISIESGDWIHDYLRSKGKVYNNRVEITIPNSAKLDFVIDSMSGSVAVSGCAITGDFEADTMSGSVTLQDSSIDGNVGLHTMSGSAKTANSTVSGNLEMGSMSGSVRIANSNFNSLTASTISGTGQLDLHDSADNYDISFSSVTGSFEYNGTKTDEDRLRNRSAGCRVKLSSTSGSFSVNDSD